MMHEALAGYDLRELCFRMAAIWPPARRRKFLLRPEVRKPLSVDTAVWPSLFDTGQGAGLYNVERADHNLSGAADRRGGPNLGLWESLADIDRALASSGVAQCDHCTVAVTLQPLGSGSSQSPPYSIGNLAGGPWELLGYDVADSSLLSGLSNCGYARSEAEIMVREWAGDLNDACLFRDPDRADEFCAVANLRVAEHAPFYVFGLWRRTDS